MHKVSTYLWGLVLVALGVIWGASSLGIINFDIFFPGWWTLFIIVPCFIGLFDGRGDSKVGNLIGILIGLCLMLGCLDVLSLEIVLKLIVPIMLVVAGLAILLQAMFGRKIAKRMKKLHKKDGKNEHWATFSGQKVDYTGKEFSSCTLEAVFGGVECDLRKAKFAKEATISASAVFGGIKIYVPEDVKVEISAAPIFGGVEDKRKYHAEKMKATLYIEASAVFGGVEIRNA